MEISHVYIIFLNKVFKSDGQQVYPYKNQWIYDKMYISWYITIYNNVFINTIS